ncbi:Hypothetical_protein [Hexamita inflata]|uniref:Hypothetical_protein n=1 Tax=Hexamita inflata TaxID=28002 RepID=A0AA86QCG8_9EUKA|nr:Hypothetical protein HINF_LOCUS44344 [Hexamita inflata]
MQEYEELRKLIGYVAKQTSNDRVYKILRDCTDLLSTYSFISDKADIYSILITVYDQLLQINPQQIILIRLMNSLSTFFTYQNFNDPINIFQFSTNIQQTNEKLNEKEKQILELENEQREENEKLNNILTEKQTFLQKQKETNEEKKQQELLMIHALENMNKMVDALEHTMKDLQTEVQMLKQHKDKKKVAKK